MRIQNIASKTCLGTSPKIMGILNVTPDSFSDGGQCSTPAAALKRAQAMVAAGAHIIDIGAESTRPGSQGITETEELARLMPVLNPLLAWVGAEAPGVQVSVDSAKLGVQLAALSAGAHIINDVRGGSAELFAAAAQAGAGVVIMHSPAAPQHMQKPEHTAYAETGGDVVLAVEAFLSAQVNAARAAGVQHIWADPGIGFGKTFAQNVALLKATARLSNIAPVLIGLSRKRFIKDACAGTPAQAFAELPEDRLPGSLAGALHAAQAGASVLRVHGVPETAQALAVWRALNG